MAKKRKTAENVLPPLEKSSVLPEKSPIAAASPPKAAKSMAKKGKVTKAKKSKAGKRTDTKGKKESKPADPKSPIPAMKSLDFDESKRFGSRAAARRASDMISKDLRSLSSSGEDEDANNVESGFDKIACDSSEERRERKKKRQLDETVEYGDATAKTAEPEKVATKNKVGNG